MTEVSTSVRFLEGCAPFMWGFRASAPALRGLCILMVLRSCAAAAQVSNPMFQYRGIMPRGFPYQLFWMDVTA